MQKPNDNQLLSEEKRIGMKEELKKLFKQMLEIMNFDPEHPQLKDTPKRMSKMYVDELFTGCYDEPPKLTFFPNENYDSENLSPVFLGPITVKSMCSHHFLPFTGSVYISYIPGKTVIGISKLSRIVKWFMRRPQIQEDFTKQLCDFMYKEFDTQGVIIHCAATHMCMTIRGVNQPLNTTMVTTEYSGLFRTDESLREEFFRIVGRCVYGTK